MAMTREEREATEAKEKARAVFKKKWLGRIDEINDDIRELGKRISIVERHPDAPLLQCELPPEDQVELELGRPNRASGWLYLDAMTFGRVKAAISHGDGFLGRSWEFANWTLALIHLSIWRTNGEDEPHGWVRATSNTPNGCGPMRYRPDGDPMSEYTKGDEG